MAVAIRSSAAARSNGEGRPQTAAARAAAATARSASTRPPAASRPITAPVVGLVASNAPPPTAAAHDPSTCSVLGVPTGRAGTTFVADVAGLDGTGAPDAEADGLAAPQATRPPGRRDSLQRREGRTQLASSKKEGRPVGALRRCG